MAASHVRQGVALLVLTLLAAVIPASAASPVPSVPSPAPVASVSPAPSATARPSPTPLPLPSLVPVSPLVEPGPALTREVVAYLPYWIAQHA